MYKSKKEKRLFGRVKLMPYIEVKNYSKTLKKRLVLDDVNLEVEKGEVVGLYGRNGSGKTMLLRAVAGLILPDEGMVLVNGVELKGSNRFPKSCGIIIETLEFWENLDAKSTLEVISAVNNIANEEDIARALARVGLDPNDKTKVKKFSLGMKQKLAIAQAIFEKPNLLLLDEPTNSLDKESRDNFVKIIQEEKERGCTIIISSHIMEDLNRCCDRIVEIESGKIEI